MSRDSRYRWIVTGVTAGILLGVFGVSWVIAGLIGAPLERPEPAEPTGPSWLDELLYGGDGP